MTAITKELDELRAALEEALQSPNMAAGYTYAMRGTPVVVGSTAGPRRKSNEDRVGAAIVARPLAFGGPLFVAFVCDGIGGQPRGEESASLAAATFLATCALSRAAAPDLVLKHAVVAANQAVHGLTRGSGGTTLVGVAIAADGAAAGVNCGDSRIFRLDAKWGHQLSHDQTLGAAIRDASPGRAELPDARFENELANFIGIGSDIQPEFLALNEVDQHDAIVLASDGTWNAVGDTLFLKILKAAPTHGDAVRRMLATVNFTDGPDNASMAMIASRSEIAGVLKRTRVADNVVRIAGCTPIGNVAVITHSPPPAFSGRAPAATEQLAAKKSEPTPPEVAADSANPTSVPPKKGHGRLRRGKQKRADQAALDLGGSEQEGNAGQRAPKGGAGKIEVVNGGNDGDEENPSS